MEDEVAWSNEARNFIYWLGVKKGERWFYLGRLFDLHSREDVEAAVSVLSDPVTGVLPLIVEWKLEWPEREGEIQ